MTAGVRTVLRTLPTSEQGYVADEACSSGGLVLCNAVTMANHGLGVESCRIVNSGLLHNGLPTADLPLNLLAGPPGRLDGTGLEFPVRLRLLNHGIEPVGSESI